MGDPIYADTSALVKLVLNETESRALEAFLLESGFQMVSSQIAEIELLRTVRLVDGDALGSAHEVLSRMVLLPLTASMRSSASRAEPAALRSLDAIHLATALEVQEDLTAVLTFDRKMAAACVGAGLEVVAPGQSGTG